MTVVALAQIYTFDVLGRGGLSGVLAFQRVVGRAAASSPTLKANHR